MLRKVKRLLERRHRRRVARDLDRILFLLNNYPELRKVLRKALRVKGYGE